MKQKRDHSSQPLGTPSHAKGKSQGMLQPQMGIFGVCSQHPNLGLNTVWQSVWALPLAHQGWQEEGTAGEMELGEINPFSSLALGVLQAQAQREGCREGAEVTS